MQLKVGELAKRTGVTVRTLHHYDEIGLLRPEGRTAAGHRIYGDHDIARLHRIAALRQLGLGLKEIGECLSGEAGSVGAILNRQIAYLRQRLESEERLVQMLEGIVGQVEAGVVVTSEQLLGAIEMTTVFEKYYSPDQLTRLKSRAGDVGSARMQEVQDEWSALHTAMEDARLRGIKPDAPEVQGLAQKAQALISEFTGGNTQTRSSLQTMVEAEPPAMHRLWGISEELGDYYQKVMAASGTD